MARIRRRGVLGWILGLILIAPFLRWTSTFWGRFFRSVQNESAELNESFFLKLQPIAAVLLPKMTTDQCNDVLKGFAAWVRDRDPRGEYDHLISGGLTITDANLELIKLGTSIRSIDFSLYFRQLRDFTRQIAPRKISDLSHAELESQLRVEIQQLKSRNIPIRPNGKHLFTDLLAFFYQSNFAVDLFYGRQINRLKCRGLSGVGLPPLNL